MQKWIQNQIQKQKQKKMGKLSLTIQQKHNVFEFSF